MTVDFNNNKNNQISYDDILLINSLCLFEGEPFGVLDQNRILSALGNQFQPYPNSEQASASVYKSLVINHGFMNGNKRTAVIVLYVLSLMINNHLKLSDQDLADLTYKIASEGGSHIDVSEISHQVFVCSPLNNEPSKDFNLKEEVTLFINNHRWLMEELGK